MQESNPLLDELLALAEISELSDDEESIQTKDVRKPKTINDENEDEYFLERIVSFSQNETVSNHGIKEDDSKANSKPTSIVHNGDTDSSDDESNRYFENSKYNESGNDIKYLLKERETKTGNFETSTWKQKKAAPSQEQYSPLIQKKPNTVDANMYTDPFFGIRVSKPLISSSALQERMSGRVAISMAKVKQFAILDNKLQDWVIAGVLVSKSPVKTSQKGNQYLIWTLSDLKDDLKTVSVFLFGHAYKQLWKTPIGEVMGILNPSVMDLKDGSKDQACLSVDNAQKVMILGIAKDYGVCKSKRKDGERCNVFVNVNVCEYCTYHIRQEYQKLSKRSELQSSFAGRGLNALRNKVLGKNEVFYAGKSYTAIPAKKSQKQIQRDTNLLRSLSNNSNTVTSPPVRTVKTKTAPSLDISRYQKIKDLELLKKLKSTNASNENEEKEISCPKNNFNNALNIDKALLQAEEILSGKKMFNKDSQDKPVENSKIVNKDGDFLHKPSTSKQSNIELLKSQKIDSIQNTPSTSKPLSSMDKTDVTERSKQNFFESEECRSLLKNAKFLQNMKKDQVGLSMDLNSPLLKTNAIRLNKTNLKALQYVRKNGPIKKTDENNPKKAGVKRFLETTDDGSNKKKTKTADEKFTSERFKKIMALQSKHTNLLEDIDREKEEKYFKKLEVKEKMEEKMMTVFKVDCKAVKCLQCKYKSFSAADKCKEERHVIKVIDAIKRFFKCSKCGNRTVSLEVVPLISCTNCGSSKWERTTMMKEKTAHIGETLSIRGLEEKFVGTVQTGGNLNLLVPDN